MFGDFHDPLQVRRTLYLGSGGQFNTWLEEQRNGDTEAAMRAHEKLLPLVRAAFNLPPIDHLTGYGIADEQALQVLSAFLRWLEGKG